MPNLRSTVRVPCTQFVSMSEYEAHAQEAAALLEARYRYECSLATCEERVVRDGTCAPCLRPARFTAATSTGEPLADGRILPNWREQLICDCEDRLSSRNRALVHFLGEVAGLRSWSRVLLFGPPGAADRRIAAASAAVVGIPRLGLLPANGGMGRYRLPADDAAFHLVVSPDYLHRVPPLPAALAELRRVLMPGGQLVFTVPFRDRSARSVTHAEHEAPRGAALPAEAAGEVHELGWDILDRLDDAGFADARVYCIWADELGYLGSGNIIFSASA